MLLIWDFSHFSQVTIMSHIGKYIKELLGLKIGAGPSLPTRDRLDPVPVFGTVKECGPELFQLFCILIEPNTF